MEEIIDTSGFYKEVNGEWFYAQNEVVAPDYTISRKRYEEIGVAENKDGWIWHNEAPEKYLEWKESKNKKILELKVE